MNIIELKTLKKDSKLFYELWRLTHPGGDLQHLFEDRGYEFVHAFILLNEYKNIQGWSCIYKDFAGQLRTGVYVKKHYRRQGHGKVLLNKCFEHCKKNYVSCHWFDRSIEEWKIYVAPYRLTNGEVT